MLRVVPFMSLTLALLLNASFAFSQAKKKSEPVLINGFKVRIVSKATIDEIKKQEQLFELEVTYKSLRMRWIYQTDPKTGARIVDSKTGEPKRELVWYLVYRIVNRALEIPVDPQGEQSRKEAEERTPVNTHDVLPAASFIPSFRLLTMRNLKKDKNGKEIWKYDHVYDDVIYPAAVKEINKRESRFSGQPMLKHSVEIAGKIPTITPKNAKSDLATYGVAVWRNVDPESDFLMVEMSGFSNAFIERDKLIYRKVILQKFRRTGDEFIQSEAEFERVEADDAKDSDTFFPRWVYVPDDIPAGKAPAGKTPPARQPAAKPPAVKVPAKKN